MRGALRRGPAAALLTLSYKGALRQPDLSKFDPEGAGDPEGSVFGLPFDEQESNLVLLPVPWEATTSYGRGTAGGPQAIRDASPQLDLFDPMLAAHDLAEPWRLGIHMLGEDPEIVALNVRACDLALPIIAVGGEIGDDPELRRALTEVNAASARLDAWVEEQVAARLDAGQLVGVVGGDHSTPFGAIQAIAAAHPGLGILHIDAHADLRQAYEGFERSHASVMANVLDRLDGVARLVQVGIRDISAPEYERSQKDPRVVTHLDPVLSDRVFAGASWASLCDEIVAALPQEVYVSFDIDGLDPALCPGTGTPVPGGLSFAGVMTLLLAVVRSGRRVIGFDLVEVAPSPGSEWDANVGARVLYRLCGLALLKPCLANERQTTSLGRINSGE
ncbi:MAG: agmatinase family protein [Myxococcales bacterium]|nr:agmatinase family protein [Myxococcales bacterium]